MRRLTTLFFALGGAAAASAHTLDGDHGLAQAVSHQLTGAHHLPFTLALIALGLGAALLWHRKAVRGRHR